MNFLKKIFGGDSDTTSNSHIGSTAHADTKIILHNTLSGKDDVFSPLKAGEVSMYHCGPTVYDYAHIGNLRHYILADTLRRMFELNGYNVNQVINITDVGHLTGDNLGDADSGEDRTEKAAKKTGKTAKEITDFYTDAFMKDIARLNIKIDRTKFPKPSEHIAEQIALIKTLEEKGAIYKITDGMYFDTSKFEHYGKLGNIDIKGLKEGARVEANEEKRNPTDFAVWKFSPANEKRQQEWDSPWGVGYPGWHIECSAMSMKYLGETFDIHTGGIDHIPVHHNNEIAQSELATGKPFAHYWLHNAFVNVNNGKIGKSLGTAITLSELIDKGFDALDYRYWVLTAQYHQPINFTFEILEGAKNARHSLIKMAADLLATNKDDLKETSTAKEVFGKIYNNLDTPGVIAALRSALKDSKYSPAKKINLIETFDHITGLEILKSALVFDKESLDIPSNIISLAEERKLARQQKDWKKSDELRDLIDKEGYTVTDTETGFNIRKK